MLHQNELHPQDLQLLHDGQFPILYKIFQVITASYRKFSKSEHLFCYVSKLAHTFDFCKWLFFPKKGLQNHAFRS